MFYSWLNEQLTPIAQGRDPLEQVLVISNCDPLSENQLGIYF